MSAKRGSAVIVVHGLWMGAWATTWLAHRLAAAGLRPFRFGYPSMRCGLNDNADALAKFARGIDAPELRWLGHSLGGMLIFHTLLRHDFPAGRVAMLGSPLLGSFSARRLEQWSAGRRVLGRSVHDWLAVPQLQWSLPHELGIVAGTRSLGLGRLVAPDLPMPNDGVVAVEETRLPGAKEHVCLPVSHTGMLLSSLAVDHAARFLATGSFGTTGGRA